MLKNQYKEDPEVLAFALQYANPFEHSGMRFLGPYQNTVGVYTMRRTVDVPIDTTTGRFAACIQPKIGNPSSLSEWQCLLVKSGAAGWSSSDWSSEANYTVNTHAGDMRVDPDYDSIIAPSPAKVSMWSSTGIAQVIGSIPQSVYDDADINSWDITLTAQSDGVLMTFPVDTPSDMRVIVSYKTSHDANTQINVPTLTPTAGITVTTTEYNGRLPTTTAAANCISHLEVIRMSDWGSGGPLRFQYAGGTAATTVIGAFFAEVRPYGVNSIDTGLFTSVQPVAAGAWAQWRGPLIENAGSIACALGPVNSVPEHWLSSSSVKTPFRPQEWETYTQLQKGHPDKVYPEGPITQGAFVTWRPERPEDEELFPPSVSNSTPYGPLYIAGQYSTSTGTIPSGGIVRLTYTILFQYETTNRLLTVQRSPRTYSNAKTAALNFLADMNVPIAGANGFHEWWSQFIKDAGQFFSDVGGVVGGFWKEFIGGLKPKIEYKNPESPWKITTS